MKYFEVFKAGNYPQGKFTKEEVQELAKRCGISAAQMSQRMLRLRKSLKASLEQKGVA